MNKYARQKYNSDLLSDTFRSMIKQDSPYLCVLMEAFLNAPKVAKPDDLNRSMYNSLDKISWWMQLNPIKKQATRCDNCF